MSLAAKRPAALLMPVVLLLSLLWALGLAIPHLQGRATALDPIESWLLDARYKLTGPRNAMPDVVFVAIDDATLEAGQTGPVGRVRLARLIRHIADSRAKVLVLDVLLADAGPVAERASLATALSGMPSIIAAAVRFDASGQPGVIRPHSAFAAQSEVGVVNVSTDSAGVPRFVPLFVEAEGTLLPAMPLLAAVSFTGAAARITDDALLLGDRRIPLEAGGTMPLRLLGPAGTVTTVSALEIMKPAPHAILEDKLVVLGFSAAAMGDRFVTPFGADTPGAEIIATAISQLIGGDVLRHDAQTRRWDVAHAGVLALLCLVFVVRMPVLQALPVVLALGLASFGVTVAAFGQGIWLSAALPLVLTLPPVAAAATVSLIGERQRARLSDRSLASLRRFQSPALARRIERDPDYLTTPQAQDLVIFFVDLTGFTALSQKLGAEGTRVLLQRFHSLTADAVEARGGSVINYMGDGALAVFGLDPVAGQTDADAALAAALALEKSLADWQPAPDQGALACRIGLHYGPVILSRLGADSHQQVSVSGDTVNLASRLLELAKSEAARIVATRDFTDKLGAGAELGRTRQSQMPVRGREGYVNVVVWPLA